MKSLCALLAATSMLALTSPADARANRGAPEGDYVTAYSRFSDRSISAPVRPARNGWQVRLPSGTWVYCRTSCSETLRVETIDLTESDGSTGIGYGTLQAECGILGCLQLTIPLDRRRY